jgi:hypothetical protein
MLRGHWFKRPGTLLDCSIQQCARAVHSLNGTGCVVALEVSKLLQEAYRAPTDRAGLYYFGQYCDRFMEIDFIARLCFDMHGVGFFYPALKSVLHVERMYG